MARTAAPAAFAAAPRQPACAAPTTPVDGSWMSTGAQSATRTPIATDGSSAMTMSPVGRSPARRDSARRATTTCTPCTCRTSNRCCRSTPSDVATCVHSRSSSRRTRSRDVKRCAAARWRHRSARPHGSSVHSNAASGCGSDFVMCDNLRRVTGGRTAESLAGFLGRHRLPVLLIFSILFVGPVGVRAAAKPFWHDEIYTVLLARLPTLSAHWAALHEGPDLAPPLNAFATRAVLSVAGVGHVTARIPSMVGSLTMTLAVFTVVLRRSNATLALAGACIPLFTAAYRYSYEARPYGLMMGLAALAWMAWAEAAAGRRRGLHLFILGLSLAAGLWNHYFAALVYVPIGAGELVRSVRERRIDAALWAVVCGSLVAALPLYPLIRLSAEQAPSFWSRPSLADIPAAYRFLFGTLAASFSWVAAVIAVLAVVGRFRSSTPVSPAVTVPAHEVAAAIACLLLPLVGVALALLATGAFVPRYGLSTVAGVSMIVPLVVGRVVRSAPLCDVVLLAALSGTD